MKLIEFNPDDRMYCSVAAAILGAGALGAGASIWGANKAVDAQTGMASQAIGNQQQMFGQIKNLLQPFISAGSDTLGGLQDWLNPSSGSSPLNSLMKLVTPGSDQSATLEQTPGYQFTRDQGLRAVNNQLATRGLGGSPGAVAKGAASFTTGLAGNTWQNVVNALQNLFTSGTGAKQNLVNTGVTAGNAVGGVGGNTANSISSALIGSGNAQAAGANAIGNAVGNFGGSLSTAALINQLTGKSGGLYANVTDAGKSNGVGTGGFNYLDAMAR